MGKFVPAAVGLCLTIALAACQKSGSGAVSAEDMSMGNPAAKVTMIEYASVSCPHCARFDLEVFPAFKAKYIDTGQVYYVAREALTGDPATAAAGFLTARCAGKDKYFQVVDAVYHAQQEMFTSGDPHAILLNIARSAGMTDAQFDACLTNEAAGDALSARVQHYAKDDGIDSTPTFVINGKKMDPNTPATMANLDAAIAEAR